MKANLIERKYKSRKREKIGKRKGTKPRIYPIDVNVVMFIQCY